MKVQDILTDESKWCKGALARDVNGFEVEDVWSDGAVKFCLFGAIKRALGNFSGAMEIDDKICTKLGRDSVLWNDAQDRTFAEVRGLIEELDI